MREIEIKKELRDGERYRKEEQPAPKFKHGPGDGLHNENYVEKTEGRRDHAY